ncbi:MAG: ABC transporter substrate-binding protein [Bacteroidota bacterium]
MSNSYFFLVQKCRIVLKSILILVIVISSGCGNRDRKAVNKISGFRNESSGAEKFTLEKLNGYTILTIINPWQGAKNLNQIYYLISRGCKIPDHIDSAMVIFVPLKKIICMSTTHVAMISAIGEGDAISGMSGTGFIYEKSLVEKIEKGLIDDVGYEANLNKEMILKISPDLIMMYGIGSESAGYVGKIKELGVKVIFNADYLETDPLSKAEWIKVFGALFCKENLADSIFNSEVEKYNNLKTYITQKIFGRPKVLLGLPYKDTWYVSPGNSYISKLISDAGGDYLWQNTESAISMPMGIENVYLRALTADFWLNIGSVVAKNEISMIDQRLKDLPCFKNGNLYNNNRRITMEGGNDYWESGSVYPHIILKDIASILHPDLFSADELFFYRKVN